MHKFLQAAKFEHFECRKSLAQRNLSNRDVPVQKASSKFHHEAIKKVFEGKARHKNDKLLSKKPGNRFDVRARN